MRVKKSPRARPRASMVRAVRVAFPEPSVLLDDHVTADGRSFTADFNRPHMVFRFHADAERGADHDADAGGGTLLHDPAPFRARLLDDVEVRKCGRDQERRQHSAGKNCLHECSSFEGLDSLLISCRVDGSLMKSRACVAHAILWMYLSTLSVMVLCCAPEPTFCDTRDSLC